MMNVEGLNPIGDIYTNGGNTIMDLKELPYYDAEPYDFGDAKSFDRYISDLERIVRNSFEYRQFIAYLRNIEGMNECAVLENVTNKAESKVRIEIHHSYYSSFES